jgi:ribonuclease HI
MVYYYTIIHNNTGVTVSSNKKRIAYMQQYEHEHLLWKRSTTKAEINEFIKDNTNTIIPTNCERIEPKTDQDVQKRMTEILLRKKNKKKTKTKKTLEEIEAHNKKIDQYDDGFVPDYFVYTDGACSHNGASKKSATAGYGIYFGENDCRNVSEPLDTEYKQTNNAAELTAILEANSIIDEDLNAGKMITIVSDSKYAIDCATTYGEKCNQIKWNGEIPNKNLVKFVYYAYRNSPNVRFRHIFAHSTSKNVHSRGNNAADKLAKIGSKN